jgi:predicted dehydrogenase
VNIGIIGAENSHAGQVAKYINVEKGVKGFAVTHLWGEKDEFAAKTAEQGQIPTIVKDIEDMLGEVDGVMIDHRDGKFHLAAAKPFVKAGYPVFVDKPMSRSLAEAKAFLKFRKAHRAPVCTMSSIYYHEDMPGVVKRLAKLGRLRSLRLSGPGDWNSQWGGIWFYGIHQVELMVHLVGPAAQEASLTVNGKDCTAIVNYPEGLTVSMNFLTECPYRFDIQAIGHEGTLDYSMGHDPKTLHCTTGIFTKMFRTRKEPFTEERMLVPVAILEAMEKSLAQKTPVAVAAI